MYFGHAELSRPGFLGSRLRQILQRPRQAGVSAPGARECRSRNATQAARARFRLRIRTRRDREETQTYTFGGDGQTRRLDCEFILHATTGPLVLGDYKEDFGIRLRQELSARSS